MTNNVCLQPALQWDIPAAVPARSRPIAAKASVRPLEERDLEPLADLFMQRFRKARRNARSRMEIAGANQGARNRCLSLCKATPAGSKT